MNRKAKLEKALAIQKLNPSRLSRQFNQGKEAENSRLEPLHEALVAAVEALEELQLGHSHKSGDEHLRLLGDNYGWCSHCQTKVSFGPGIAEEALSKIDKVLGEM